MKLVTVYHSDEVMPFMIIVCDKVIEYENGMLHIITEKDVITIIEYSYYHLYDYIDSRTIDLINKFVLGVEALK